MQTGKTVLWQQDNTKKVRISGRRLMEEQETQWKKQSEELAEVDKIAGTRREVKSQEADSRFQKLRCGGMFRTREIRQNSALQKSN